MNTINFPVRIKNGRDLKINFAKNELYRTTKDQRLERDRKLKEIENLPDFKTRVAEYKAKLGRERKQALEKKKDAYEKGLKTLVSKMTEEDKNLLKEVFNEEAVNIFLNTPIGDLRTGKSELYNKFLELSDKIASVYEKAKKIYRKEFDTEYGPYFDDDNSRYGFWFKNIDSLIKTSLKDNYYGSDNSWLLSTIFETDLYKACPDLTINDLVSYYEKAQEANALISHCKLEAVENALKVLDPELASSYKYYFNVKFMPEDLYDEKKGWYDDRAWTLQAIYEITNKSGYFYDILVEFQSKVNEVIDSYNEFLNKYVHFEECYSKDMYHIGEFKIYNSIYDKQDLLKVFMGDKKALERDYNTRCYAYKYFDVSYKDIRNLDVFFDKRTDKEGRIEVKGTDLIEKLKDLGDKIESSRDNFLKLSNIKCFYNSFGCGKEFKYFDNTGDLYVLNIKNIYFEDLPKLVEEVNLIEKISNSQQDFKLVKVFKEYFKELRSKDYESEDYYNESRTHEIFVDKMIGDIKGPVCVVEVIFNIDGDKENLIFNFDFKNNRLKLTSNKGSSIATDLYDYDLLKNHRNDRLEYVDISYEQNPDHSDQILFKDKDVAELFGNRSYENTDSEYLLRAIIHNKFYL